MSDVGEVEPIQKPPKLVLAVSLFVLLLLPPVTLAGGGGVALLMFILACLGIIGLIAHKAYLQRLPLWLLALTAFLGWAWVTQFWSPYEKVSGFSNAEKIFVMGLVFPAVIWLWGEMRDHPLGRPLRMAILAAFGVGVALIILEYASGYKLTALYEPPAPGEDPFWRKLDAIRNLGRGMIFTSVMFMPLACLLFHIRYAKFIVFSSALLISVMAYLLGVSIAVPLPWIALCVGLIAIRFPQATLLIVLGLAICLILFSPLLAQSISLIDEEILATIPSSWEHRLYMWQFVAERVLQNPLWGYGFDSSRIFTDQVTLNNGKSVSVVSLHTHNAGLQIWLETGFIGALLASGVVMALYLPARRFVRQDPYHAFGLCGFLIAFILVSSVSFGVWQFWWWGTLCLGIACLKLMQLPTLRSNSK